MTPEQNSSLPKGLLEWVLRIGLNAILAGWLYNGWQGEKVENRAIIAQQFTPTAEKPVGVDLKGKTFFVSFEDSKLISRSRALTIPIWIAGVLTMVANVRVVSGSFDFFHRRQR